MPEPGRCVVAVAAPGSGPGFWAGASSAACGPDGRPAIAHRLRKPGRPGSQIVVVRSDGGERLETLEILETEHFGAESLERPALVRLEQGWRLYVTISASSDSGRRPW